MTRWLVGIIAGCAGVATPEGLSSGTGGAPDGFRCPEGADWTVEAPGVGAARIWPDTEVHGCKAADGTLDGPHLERWPGGGIASEGAWAKGVRDGVWTSWFPDGAFRSQRTWRSGTLEGPRREVARDGRIVELEMSDGAATGLRSLAAGTPVPEWEAGARVESSRYRAHPGGGPLLAP